VAPDYALPTASTAAPIEFELDVPALESMGCHVFFASAEHVIGNTYRTIGASRTVSIGAIDSDLDTACALVYQGIAQHVKGALQYRTDVASLANIEAALKRLRP
jgi:phosphoribosylamine-glycine ligase